MHASPECHDDIGVDTVHILLYETMCIAAYLCSPTSASQTSFCILFMAAWQTNMQMRQITTTNLKKQASSEVHYTSTR